MTTGVRPGSPTALEQFDAVARAREKTESAEARDAELAERTARLADLRTLPVFKDLQALTELMYAQLEEAVLTSTGDAHWQAIGGKAALADWWRRLGAGEALGKAAMRRILERQFGSALTEPTMRR